jgi:hypothetical protein
MPQSTLSQVLSYFDTIVTEIVEELFVNGTDPNKTIDGINRSGYAVNVQLRKNIHF